MDSTAVTEARSTNELQQKPIEKKQALAELGGYNTQLLIYGYNL